MRNFIFLLLSLTLGISGILQAEEIYKWRDDNGNVVYSQYPPEDDRQYQRINRESTDSEAEETEAAPEDTGDEEEQDGENGADNKTQSKKGYSKEDIARRELMKEENCKKAQEALDLYTINRRFEGEDGKVVTLTEEQQQANIRKAEQAIEEFCN